MRCLAGLVGERMIIFSCPACGGGAFTLSEDFSEVHCATPLGSWQALRRDISKAFVALRQSPPSSHRVSRIAYGSE